MPIPKVFPSLKMPILKTPFPLPALSLVFSDAAEKVRVVVDAVVKRQELAGRIVNAGNVERAVRAVRRRDVG